MFWRKTGKNLGLALLAVPGIACASSGATGFLTSSQLKVQIEQLAAMHPENVKILDIGQSFQNRHLYVLRIGTGKPTAPALLAIFGQHADEHETTSLALGLTRALLEQADRDDTLASQLEKVTVYIAPMLNPDGMDYSLLDPEIHRDWRKNRSPQDNGEFGVDLNRNWGAFWDVPTGSGLFSTGVKNSADPNFRGGKPFSELETRVLRDFIYRHDDIHMLLDYHTGSASFMQGAVLLPYSYAGKAVPSTANLCARQLPETFAGEISDRTDPRKPFRTVQANQMGSLVVEQTPVLLKPLMWAAISGSTAASGTAIDWTASHGMCSMGIEISLRDRVPTPQQESRLIEDQSRGLRLLLNSLMPAQAAPEKDED